MKYGDILRQLRNSRNLSQKELTDRLKLNRSTYARYETSTTQPDFDTLNLLADFYNVTVDYILGREQLDSTQKVTVAGKEIELTQEEFEVFNEIRKHSVAFHDLATDPEKKVKQLIKMWEFIKKDLNDDDEGEGFGKLED